MHFCRYPSSIFILATSSNYTPERIGYDRRDPQCELIVVYILYMIYITLTTLTRTVISPSSSNLYSAPGGEQIDDTFWKSNLFAPSIDVSDNSDNFDDLNDLNDLGEFDDFD